MRRKREGMSEAQWKLNMVAVIVLMIVYLIVTLYNSERLAAQVEKNVEPSIRDGGCRRRVKDVYCKNAGTGRTSL